MINLNEHTLHVGSCETSHLLPFDRYFRIHGKKKSCLFKSLSLLHTIADSGWSESESEFLIPALVPQTIITFTEENLPVPNLVIFVGSQLQRAFGHVIPEFHLFEEGLPLIF